MGGDPSFEKWWGSDTEFTGRWRESDWMGVYLPNIETNWIYHIQLGWLYVEEDEHGGLWMWMPEEKWIWTKQEVWPFLWSEESANWLYPVSTHGILNLYDYQVGSFR